MPFSPPSGFYTPRMPQTSFYSHMRPFANMPPQMARQWRTPIPNNEQMVPTRPQPVALPAPPAAAKMAGAMFGHGAAGLSPYKVMRTGLIPGIRASGAGGMRVGVTSAAQLIKRVTPGGYTGVNVPGGR